MTTKLPGPPIPTMTCLLRALDGVGSERDQHIAKFALGHLNLIQQQVVLVTFWESARGVKFETPMDVNRVTFSKLEAPARAAFLVVLWRLGLISALPRGMKLFPRQHFYLSNATFACLGCGNPVQVRVSETGAFDCPHCNFRLHVRVNDGHRVAFGRPKPVKAPPVKPVATQLQAAYKTLGVPLSATVDDIKKAHHVLIKQHHPDRCFGQPGALAATEYTAKLNAARDLIEQDRTPCGTGR